MGLMRWRGVVAVLVVLSVLAAGVIVAPSAGAATTTYSAEETIGVPPASGFQGSGGGDGWAVALTPTAVFNVHHHNSTITVACRNQVDAGQCWTAQTKEATDATGGTFNTLHPGLHLNQASGFLYVYGTRNADGVGGVVCLDTALADADPNPFCGFTALTAPGQSSYGYVTNGVSVGNRFYAVNHDNGSGLGTRVLCFDVAATAACPGQPYTAGVGSASTGNANTISAIGSRLYVPNPGNIGCFDTSSATECAGSWPVAASTGYGAPFPLLDASGNAIGVCNPDGTVPCFDLSGSLVPTPAGLSGAVGSTQYWNGPALTIGSRVYVPSGTNDTVVCYDYATAATCPNFPHPVPGASYMYTVNPDPQRPSCIWINADNGAAQIQNFDAFSGLGCGEGPIRVLASSIVVNSPECTPTAYTSLAVLEPPPDQYGSGSVAFEDGSGQPIPGVEDVPLDEVGVADLQGLDLNTEVGLPQFLITLTDPVGTPGSVTVRLTWTGESDPSCNPDGEPPVGRYVAVGDSYSSGEGNRPYDEGTDVFQSRRGARARKNACHRSAAAWPRLLGVAPEHHLACSGAKIQHLYAGQEKLPPDDSSQLSRLRGILLDELPIVGVTVTIGGNDLGFADILGDCFFKECLKKVDSNEIPRAFNLRSSLAQAYRDVQSAADGARVLVVGYPRIVLDRDEGNGNCAWLEPVEADRISRLTNVFFGVIKLAASDAGVEYVDVDQLFDGHELCTADSWVTPIGGFGYSYQEMGHPTTVGQEALEDAVRAYLAV